MPSLRLKPSDGTLVCTECHIVEESGIIDMTNETRFFASENSANQTLARTGKGIRLDQMNSLVTEFRGGNKFSGASKMNVIS